MFKPGNEKLRKLWCSMRIYHPHNITVFRCSCRLVQSFIMVIAYRLLIRFTKTQKGEKAKYSYIQERSFILADKAGIRPTGLQVQIYKGERGKVRDKLGSRMFTPYLWVPMIAKGLEALYHLLPLFTPQAKSQRRCC